jgi:single-stranded DNA-binding protein
MNYQKIILVGNVTKDANRQTSKKGDVHFTTFTLAVGDGKDSTTYFPVVAFGILGEITAKYVTQGSQALVEGRIQLSEKGHLSIIADKVQFGARPRAVEKTK